MYDMYDTPLTLTKTSADFASNVLAIRVLSEKIVKKNSCWRIMGVRISRLHQKLYCNTKTKPYTIDCN